MDEAILAADECSGAMVMRGQDAESVKPSGYYTAECYDADGSLKWRDEVFNVITTVGKNDFLDKYLAGAAYTAACFLGLKGAGVAVVGDTQASHASWAEVGTANAPAYSGTRKTPVFAAASAGSKATSAAASFTFTSAGTVAGVFLNVGGTSAQDNTTGVLFSAGDLSGGSRSVVATDVLNITFTATLT